MDGNDHSIAYGIVCDDIRREDNGKVIIIGMYANDIRLSTIPSHMMLSFLIAFDSKDAGEVRFEAVLSLKDSELGRAEGEFNLKKGRSLITLPRLGFEIKETGQLKFVARLDAGEWVELWNGPIGKPEQMRTNS